MFGMIERVFGKVLRWGQGEEKEGEVFWIKGGGCVKVLNVRGVCIYGFLGFFGEGRMDECCGVGC